MAATSVVMAGTTLAAAAQVHSLHSAPIAPRRRELSCSRVQLQCELLDSQGLRSLATGHRTTSFPSSDAAFGLEGGAACPDRFFMAVPKKRLSRTKTKIRKAIWKAQSKDAALKAFSLGSSVLTGRSKSFLYETSEKKEEGAAEESKEEGGDDVESS